MIMLNTSSLFLKNVRILNDNVPITRVFLPFLTYPSIYMPLRLLPKAVHMIPVCKGIGLEGQGSQGLMSECERKESDFQ